MTEQLRIALVTERFHPAVDGDTPLARHLAEHLAAGGDHVEMLTSAPGLASFRGVTVTRITQLAPGHQVRRALERIRPDIVLVTTPGSIGESALKHGRRLRARTVTIEQSDRAAYATERWRVKVAERSDRLVTTSTWMRDRLAAQDVDARLWAPGVDTDCFSPSLRDQPLHDSWARVGKADPPLVVVGYAGSLRKRNGVRRLAGLAELPGVRLVAIGEGAQRTWLRDRLPRVKFTGHLETGEIAVAMASLDLLVHPGPRQTSAPALREASASGLPVVAPRSGGAVDVVRHLESGLLYDPEHPSALVDAVGAVAADPRRRLLGLAGRRLMLERDWKVAVDELVTSHLDRRRVHRAA